jgi:hypothetical protein
VGASLRTTPLLAVGESTRTPPHLGRRAREGHWRGPSPGRVSTHTARFSSGPSNPVVSPVLTPVSLEILPTVCDYTEPMHRVLSPSRWRAGLAVFFGLMFLPSFAGAGGLVGALIGLAVLAIFGIRLLPGASYLKIDDHGFTVRSIFRDHHQFQWKDIEGFKVITMRYMGFIPLWSRVGYDFAESYRKRSLPGKVVHALARYDGLLPDNYGMKAKDLAALLESLRRQHQQSQPGPPPPMLDAVRLGTVEPLS